jgi:hypothetical protein
MSPVDDDWRWKKSWLSNRSIINHQYIHTYIHTLHGWIDKMEMGLSRDEMTIYMGMMMIDNLTD